MFSLIRKFLTLVIVLIVGIALGGYAVTKIQPRQLLDFKNCSNNCFDSKQFLGLVGSIGIQFDQVPNIILETDKTIVVKHPEPSADIHYVLIPKKDIKNIEDLQPEDEPYIMDIMAVNRELVKREGLTKYRLTTNGPGYQEVAYLHFHLIGRK